MYYPDTVISISKLGCRLFLDERLVADNSITRSNNWPALYLNVFFNEFSSWYDFKK